MRYSVHCRRRAHRQSLPAGRGRVVVLLFSLKSADGMHHIMDVLGFSGDEYQRLETSNFMSDEAMLLYLRKLLYPIPGASCPRGIQGVEGRAESALQQGRPLIYMNHMHWLLRTGSPTGCRVFLCTRSA